MRDSVAKDAITKLNMSKRENPTDTSAAIYLAGVICRKNQYALLCLISTLSLLMINYPI